MSCSHALMPVGELAELFSELRWKPITASACVASVDDVADDEPLSVFVRHDEDFFVAELHRGFHGRLVATLPSPTWDVALLELAAQLRNLKRAGVEAPWLESAIAGLLV